VMKLAGSISTLDELLSVLAWQTRWNGLSISRTCFGRCFVSSFVS
jgi:hypothetical protein